MLTAERLRDVLDYDPGTGIFRWKSPTSRRMRVGSIAGSTNGNGFVQISFDYRLYVAARLAWLYMTGEWPSDLIVHKDGDTANNRWSNLRAATKEQVVATAKAPADSRLGAKGVTRSMNGEKFVAKIGHAGKTIYIGTYETLEAAKAAYDRRATTLHSDFARVG